jgi:hypothetical protein
MLGGRGGGRREELTILKPSDSSINAMTDNLATEGGLPLSMMGDVCRKSKSRKISRVGNQCTDTRREADASRVRNHTEFRSTQFYCFNCQIFLRQTRQSSKWVVFTPTERVSPRPPSHTAGMLFRDPIARENTYNAAALLQHG